MTPSQEKNHKTDSISLFYVYAHEDGELCDELDLHLSGLRRQGVFTNRYDSEIILGEYWTQKTKTQFNSADIILLLVDPHFIASDDCYRIEMSRAIERHERGEALVIPIILRPVLWEGTPFDKLQVLPMDGKPITTWTNRDEAFLNVVQGIRTAITLPSHLQSVKEQLPLSTAVIHSPIKVLYIYAHEDSMLCHELEKHLSGLKRQGIITEWRSLDIAINDWISEIEQYIHQVQLILPLISSAFLASENCYSIEIQNILERHYTGEAIVIPIILRPSDWQASPFSSLAVLPVEGKAVTTWDNQDGAFLDITLGIRKTIALLPPSQLTSRDQKQQNMNITRYKSEHITSGPINFFYIYAREDTDLLEHLRKHLRPLTNQGLVVESYDRLISAGADWSSYLSQKLDSAQFILLLVTANFLASDYCYSIEMKRALERHEAGECIVIPVILRPVDWFGTPIGKLQALPTSGKPVTTWTDIDEAFSDIAQNIRHIVLSLLNQEIQKTKEQWILEGKVHYDGHQYDEALAAYRKALDLDASDELVCEKVGRILIQLERYDEAFATYESLLRTSPSASAYLFKGLVLQRIGKSVEALAAYQKAREYGYSG